MVSVQIYCCYLYTTQLCSFHTPYITCELLSVLACMHASLLVDKTYILKHILDGQN